MSDEASRPDGEEPTGEDGGDDPIHRDELPHARIVEDSGGRGFFRSRGASGVEIALVTALAFAILIPGIWAYTLVDPWETHYAEVARRMLQEDDWVHLHWQNEGFRSKPVLTFWLIAGSMQSFGLGDGGGFSGEMVSSPLVMFAVRLPFVLFGILGLVMTWWMLARLVSRRVAWLAFGVVATTPFFFFVARQAITDMPMVGTLMGALACFAMAVHAGDRPIERVWRRIDTHHVFLAAFSLVVGWQALYYYVYFSKNPGLAGGVRFPHPEIILPLAMLWGLAVFIVWSLEFARSTRSVYMYWFYLLLAIGTLGKGLPGIGLAGMVCLSYLLLTGHWRLLGKVEIPRGILLVSLVVVPWHIAMWLKDGRPFLRDYFMTHLWKRATSGVHGERGTFNFFFSQIGIGMWPWIALVPAAIASGFNRVVGNTREGRVRLIIGIWAIAGVALFSLVQTKFHHYVLPAVPALAILVAFWLDDVIAGRVRRVGLACAAGVALILLIGRDFLGEEKQLIELFVYRYDRPWPSKEPWLIDLTDTFMMFTVLFAVAVAAIGVKKIRKWAIAGMLGVSLVWGYWAMNVYMGHAAQHWGMRDALRTYYEMRDIHGLDIVYYGERQIADDWSDFDGQLMVESFLPDDFDDGLPMTVRIRLKDPRGREVREEVLLHGTVSHHGGHRFWIALSDREVAKLDELIERGARREPPRREPFRMVNADRLIAWQLYWRGENFWSGDEIWKEELPETRTAYKQTDNKEFLEYLKEQGIPGRRYFVMTESGRANNLRNVLPTKNAKDTWKILDTSSNKFTLLSFVL